MNKKEKRNYKILLFFLIIVLIAVDYPVVDKIVKNIFIDYEVGVVERVIDGDTLVANGSTVRLLGVNCPEKGEKYYEEAKEFLENKTLYTLIKLKYGKEEIDMYQRKLRYVFTQSNENVNLDLVRFGYANYYFPSGKDNYYPEFREAWQNCVEDEINLCEKSSNPCADCISLIDFNVENQKVVLRNDCSFYCDLSNWTIKDEGRKKFIFKDYVLQNKVEIILGNGTDTKTKLYWKNENYVWTDTGDTLFLRDSESKLVLWKGY